MKIPAQLLLKKERRKYQRAYLEIEAKVSSAKFDGQADAVIQNISGGGVRILLDRDLPVVSKVNLEFALPDEEDLIRCEGEVVWCLPNKKWYSREAYGYKIGIKFLSIRQEEKAKLISFAFSRITKSSG